MLNEILYTIYFNVGGKYQKKEDILFLNKWFDRNFILILISTLYIQIELKYNIIILRVGS